MSQPTARRLLSLGALAVAGVLLAACSTGGSVTLRSLPPGTGSTATVPSAGGSSGGSTGGGSNPPSKSAYLAAGNAICADMNSASQQASQQIAPNGPTTPEDTRLLLDHEADIIDQALLRLEALTPPTGDEATLKALYDEIDQLVGTARKASAALARGDLATAQSLLHQLDAQTAKANADSIAYGLTECGSDPSSPPVTA